MAGDPACRCPPRADSGEAGALPDAGRTAAAQVAAVRGGVTVLMSGGRTTHLEAALHLPRDPAAATPPGGA
ncbi:hypothetical protein [Streptomyces sp. NPDC014623]|uniref:hypothetical protein n=1 Tax=Streptomyces sp. NPDC014623 TaxID=3364875 RepID=UPI003700171A